MRKLSQSSKTTWDQNDLIDFFLMAICHQDWKTIAIIPLNKRIVYFDIFSDLLQKLFKGDNKQKLINVMKGAELPNEWLGIEKT